MNANITNITNQFENLTRMVQGPAPEIIVVKVHRGIRSTVVSADIVSADAEMIEVHAEAIRHPDDKHDALVAHDLAVGRALESLGRKMQRRARGRVDMIEHNTAHSKASKGKKPKNKKKK